MYALEAFDKVIVRTDFRQSSCIIAGRLFLIDYLECLGISRCRSRVFIGRVYLVPASASAFYVQIKPRQIFRDIGVAYAHAWM